jgi:hypothetical protein
MYIARCRLTTALIAFLTPGDRRRMHLRSSALCAARSVYYTAYTHKYIPSEHSVTVPTMLVEFQTQRWCDG